ncbi:LysR family transcriptional regulator [Streptomyces nogalater]
MELRHLRTFETVARTLSVTQAARELHYAQSSVSDQIQALERELGWTCSTGPSGGCG